MSNDEIKKENNPRKKMLNYINFRILWPGSLDKKKHTWKNYETQFLTNQMQEDEIEKNNNQVHKYI